MIIVLLTNNLDSEETLPTVVGTGTIKKNIITKKKNKKKSKKKNNKKKLFSTTCI